MSNLVARVKNILLTPKTEWPVIAAEPETTAGLYTKYILILAALGPIAQFLKMTVIGMSVPFVGNFRVDMGTGLEMLILSYVGSLIGVYVFALVINALAPTFGGQKDSVQALKAAAYSSTAVWVAGIAQLVGFLSVLIMIAGLVYCIYLLYHGLQHTMKAPADRAGGYTAASIIVAIIVWIVISVIVNKITGYGLMNRPGATITSSSGSFEKGSVGAGIEEWAKGMEAAGKAVEQSAQQNNGAPSAEAIGSLIGAAVSGGKGVDALPAEELKAYLPETLGGLPRTSFSASRNAALGFQVAEATADYGDGSGRSLRLEINDAGGARGVFALANWANVEEERQWQGGYEKTYRADGRMVHERWDSGSGSGEYSLVVGERFSVELSGNAGNIDELKATLGSGVNLGGLETVARATEPAG